MNTTNSFPEGIDERSVFPLLNPGEILVAEKFGCRERFEAGQVLFEPGQQLVDLLIILDGYLEVIDTSGEQERILTIHGMEVLLGTSVSSRIVGNYAVPRQIGRRGDSHSGGCSAAISGFFSLVRRKMDDRHCCAVESSF